MSSILTAVSGVPFYVWLILGYLIYVGMQALKPRVVSVNRLIFLPLVLIALKYNIFTSQDAWVYAAGILTGMTAGYFKARKISIEVNKASRMLVLPGSSSLIVVLLGFFVLKYYFGYLQAVDPQAYAQKLWWAYGLSGILSGFFIGQRVSYLKSYFSN